MPPINILIKPASGNCNMRCTYCFYFDEMSNRVQEQYGMMTELTLENTIREALAYAQGECTIAYQGGEPSLRGLDFFRKSMAYQKTHNINQVKIFNVFQTNGYQLDEAWADFFRDNHFLVGVSLDGNQSLHDAYRITPTKEGTFKNVMNTIRLFKDKRVEFNLLTVVNGKNALKANKVYEYFKKMDLKYFQFIACLDPLNEEKGKYAYCLTPDKYGIFLKDLFDLWYQDLMKGKQPYIRQFENYISILMGVGAESCDMRGTCGLQYTVEADGAVYPCDFYVLDLYKIGNFNEDSVESMDKKRAEIGFVEASMKYASTCLECEYFSLCRAGCRRTRDEVTNEQFFCKAYKVFFAHTLTRMKRIALQLKNVYNK